MRFSPLRGAIRGGARLGLVPRALWGRLPVEAGFNVKLATGQNLVYESSADDGVGRALYWRGLRGWEPETLGVFFSLARSASIVLDVGAFTGLFGMLAAMANPRSRVFCFEPFPPVFQRLRRHIQINNLTSQVEARNVAVSDVPGVMNLFVPASQAPAGASLRTGGLRGDASYSTEVNVTTLDTACESIGVPELVKIDVEGMEDKVLNGMQGILSRARPDFVIECLSDGPYAEVDRILSNRGYRFYHLLPSGPSPRERIVPDPKFVYLNYLCSARDDLASMAATTLY